MDTILIADHDLAFVFWLGGALGEAGYKALPAKRITDAAAWAGKFEIDVLVVNPSLPGAADFVRQLRCSQGHLQVIALGGDQRVPVSQLDDVLTWAARPVQITPQAKRQWMNVISQATTSAVSVQ